MKLYVDNEKDKREFEKFWQDEEEREPKTCEQMIRSAIQEINTFDESDSLEIPVIREMLMECLRGCY